MTRVVFDYNPPPPLLHHVVCVDVDWWRGCELWVGVATVVWQGSHTIYMNRDFLPKEAEVDEDDREGRRRFARR